MTAGILFLAQVSPAHSAESGPAVAGTTGDSMGSFCSDDPSSVFCEEFEIPGGPSSAVGGDSEPDSSDLPPLTYRLVIGANDDGSPCVVLVAQWVGAPGGAWFAPEQAAEIRSRLAVGEEYYDPALQSDFPAFGTINLPLCDNDGDQVDVAGLAQQVWVGVQIESPETKIAPGYMLTGLTSYLELDATSELVATQPLPDGLGTLTITATPEHHIDWDDGGEATVTTSTGVPYPGGPEEITHVFTTAAVRTVQVTTHWTGTFSGPGFTDEPLGVRVAATTDLPLDVREWQSVRAGR